MAIKWIFWGFICLGMLISIQPWNSKYTHNGKRIRTISLKYYDGSFWQAFYPNSSESNVIGLSEIDNPHLKSPELIMED